MREKRGVGWGHPSFACWRNIDVGFLSEQDLRHDVV